jgi:hypothetical protein
LTCSYSSCKRVRRSRLFCSYKRVISVADDNTEVSKVKQILSSHIDIDVDATWGVFLDQMCPRDAPADDDDMESQERIRSLLISYLVWETRHNLPRHISEPKQETVITSSLFKVPIFPVITKPLALTSPSGPRPATGPRREEDRYRCPLALAKLHHWVGSC